MEGRDGRWSAFVLSRPCARKKAQERGTGHFLRGSDVQDCSAGQGSFAVDCGGRGNDCGLLRLIVEVHENESGEGYGYAYQSGPVNLFAGDEAPE